ncbi:hypothetical protein DACRYDRAFT_103417 [Dacryopinax primogenitus]|uniref:Transcription elongation factor Eaf N-terminal domain-containing protein n=1 Tax=Dacryopinax primogenitus (strain DJM 731) TaxID=1858805 RepID=M5G8D0_DACPD|nr:uncharacterized protein DACRYDRAFT_103417 [Dacryopinax primogenitus]EJU06471.1 hypothetical protein DACRYDRAFT_103417 [Dacryopinax primogenitus]
MAAVSPLLLPSSGTHPVRIGTSLKRKFASLDADSNPGGRRQRQRRELPESEFHAVQFGRQPESVDPASGSMFDTTGGAGDGSSKIQVERQSATGERFLFTGTQTASKLRDCLLLWDPNTNSFTLEVLSSSTTLAYDRSATNVLRRQQGIEVSLTPSAGGSGSGSGGSAVQPPAVGGDEPTPLDLGGYGDADMDAEADADAEGDPDVDEEPSPVNRNTNTSEETYVNADLDPDLEEPELQAYRPAPAPVLRQRQPPRTIPAYEEIDMRAGYVSEDSDLLAEGDGDVGDVGDLDADGVTDADAEGVTDDAEAEVEVEPTAHEQEQDADEELDDFLLADLTAHQEEEEEEPEPEPTPVPEPEHRSRRGRSSTSHAHAAPTQPPVPPTRPQPPALRTLALPTARRMSLRSATTQAINSVSSASTLPSPGTAVNGANGAEKKWDDDSDSDSEDDEDDEEEGDGEDSEFDFLAAELNDPGQEEQSQAPAEGDEDWEDVESGQSPLAGQSRSRGRQLDIWGDEDDE